MDTASTWVLRATGLFGCDDTGHELPAGTHVRHSLPRSTLNISESFRPANAALLVMTILGLASRASTWRRVGRGPGASSGAGTTWARPRSWVRRCRGIGRSGSSAAAPGWRAERGARRVRGAGRAIRHGGTSSGRRDWAVHRANGAMHFTHVAHHQAVEGEREAVVAGTAAPQRTCMLRTRPSDASCRRPVRRERPVGRCAPGLRESRGRGDLPRSDPTGLFAIAPDRSCRRGDHPESPGTTGA
jgi:hypothetical protein